MSTRLQPTLVSRILWWLLGTTVVSTLCIGLVVISGQHLPILVTLAIIATISITSAGVLLHILRKHFLKPLNQLTQVSQEVSITESIRLRAPKLNQDELGQVVDAFNAMLDRMESREAELKSERDRATVARQRSDGLASEAQRALHSLEFEVAVRQRIERKLTDVQTYMNAIINSMPSALIAVDDQLMVTQWNTGATHFSGNRDDKAMGRDLADAFPFLAEHQDLIEQALAEQVLTSRHNLPFTLDDKPGRIDLIVYPLHLTGTKGAVIRIDDVTEQFKLEEVMVQTEKMMSVGGMAAGMAHEINNPLGAIVQNAQNIQRRLDPHLKRNAHEAEQLGLDLNIMQRYLLTREVYRFLDNITESGLRASRIVRNMLQFSRDSGTHLTYHAVGPVLAQAINIALNDYNLRAGYAHHHLYVDQDFRSPDTRVPCVLTELEQVLLNLMKNGAQAIKERFDTLNDIDEGIIQIRQYVDEDYCVIEVSDNGVGMNEATRKQIFEPFFTTKEIGVGTGLGLSVSFFIITAHHHGRMTVESEIGEGSRFIIRLPLSSPGEYKPPAS